MSLDREHTQIERAVLEEVLHLHPDHLTIAELMQKVAADRDRSEDEGIAQAIRDLTGSGLLREIDDVVVPTHAALRAAALLLWP